MLMLFMKPASECVEGLKVGVDGTRLESAVAQMNDEGLQTGFGEPELASIRLRGFDAFQAVRYQSLVLGVMALR